MGSGGGERDEREESGEADVGDLLATGGRWVDGAAFSGGGEDGEEFLVLLGELGGRWSVDE